jgi:hypothetical protein
MLFQLVAFLPIWSLIHTSNIAKIVLPFSKTHVIFETVQQLTLIVPGEVKVDPADFDVRLLENFRCT